MLMVTLFLFGMCWFRLYASVRAISDSKQFDGETRFGVALIQYEYHASGESESAFPWSTYENRGNSN